MANTYAKLIQERIFNAEDGTIFINSDFADITDADTIRRNLNRQIEKGNLRRVLNGIYEKPKYSSFLKEYIAPDPNMVANTIARSFGWTISPSGNTALNLLGLSTQVPTTWTYVSDGPYREFTLDNITIKFKHRTNKEITGLSYITLLVIQALKTIGKDNITDSVILHLSKRLSLDDKNTIINETSKVTAWIRKKILSIKGDPHEKHSKDFTLRESRAV